MVSITGKLSSSCTGQADSRSGPVLTSLVGTLKRTKRIEGWYGLYKGTPHAADRADERNLSYAHVCRFNQFLLDRIRRRIK
jgi:hypothetical protein